MRKEYLEAVLQEALYTAALNRCAKCRRCRGTRGRAEHREYYDFPF
jgi:hypothetical protein